MEDSDKGKRRPVDGPNRPAFSLCEEISTKAEVRPAPHARAHDTIDDTVRCDTMRCDDDYASGVFYDGLNLPYTEEELKAKLKVDFIRTPRDEIIVFDEPEYLGRAKVKNEKFGYNYEAHIWRGQFIRLDDIEYDEPMQGLLQIRTKWLRKAGFLAQVMTLLVGRCRITTDEKGGIVSIEEA